MRGSSCRDGEPGYARGFRGVSEPGLLLGFWGDIVGFIGQILKGAENRDLYGTSEGIENQFSFTEKVLKSKGVGNRTFYWGF